MTGESADQPVTRIRCSHRKRKREESEPVEIEVLKDFRPSPEHGLARIIAQRPGYPADVGMPERSRILEKRADGSRIWGLKCALCGSNWEPGDLPLGECLDVIYPNILPGPDGVRVVELDLSAARSPSPASSGTPPTRPDLCLDPVHQPRLRRPLVLRRAVRSQRRPHRVPRDPQPPGHLADRHTLSPVPPSDLRPVLHTDHPPRSSRVVSFHPSAPAQFSSVVDRPGPTITIHRCWSPPWPESAT
jgi:hypothetical protein